MAKKESLRISTTAGARNFWRRARSACWETRRERRAPASPALVSLVLCHRYLCGEAAWSAFGFTGRRGAELVMNPENGRAGELELLAQLRVSPWRRRACADALRWTW